MKLSEPVLAALSNVDVVYPNGVRIVDKLERKLYLEVDKALQALGGKWNRKAGAHVFELEIEPGSEGDARARVQALIDRAITTGEVETNADLGFFQTPMPLARELVVAAAIRADHSVLEPSAGLGALYQAIIETSIDRPNHEAPAFVGLVERNVDRRNKLKLSTRSCDEVCENDDFMDFDESEPYDRVVMNPPFCKVGQGDHLDHVTRAFMMIVPGGILVSVLPASVLFRTDKRHMRFRQWAEKYGEITPLPDGSFRESGTDVRTCVLKAIKR